MKKLTKAQMQEYSDQREAESHLRNAQGYLAHALKSLIEGNKKAVHQSMARVKECFREVNLRLNTNG